ncbi:MAG TPA: phosphatase PAP2 family protein [Candidatus Caccovicinus merdipullorum]|uniref:Phosphatase PAP2 family protein n=1 Tax=Candidatus Caccovicinus merdipullorum TaxID=2840724 RepID=A0A9D1KEB5_9FIRM|nr:phosphatase PAP2 family protein [Candidatus Caccovicinus merdipullorum]
MIRWIKTHPYCLVNLYLVFYLIGFFTLEMLVPEPQYVIHSVIDDWIPFNEWFVLPYFLWYLWVPGFLLYFMLRERDSFLRLAFIMFAGMTICLIIYALWPNGLQLRREIEADNFCADIVRFLRAVDTPNNVCPSIHVSSTVAIHIVICRSDAFRNVRFFRLLSWTVSVLICLSTMFIKQHSAIDVFWGWLLSLLLGAVAYRKGGFV